MIALFIKLLCAHLLGDFILQGSSFAKKKSRYKFGSFHLYLHSFIHGVLVYLLVWNWDAWLLSIFVGVSHFIIDGMKVTYGTRKYRRQAFFIDQLLHVITIVIASYLFSNDTHIELGIHPLKIYLFISCIILLTITGSIFVKVIISRWTPSHKPTLMDGVVNEKLEDNSLKDAGKYIGILERLFVFGFVISGNMSAIGFLLGAKSIFRFGDLFKDRNRAYTEYVIIGTLLSFGIALLIGIIYKFLLSRI